MQRRLVPSDSGGYRGQKQGTPVHGHKQGTPVHGQKHRSPLRADKVAPRSHASHCSVSLSLAAVPAAAGAAHRSAAAQATSLSLAATPALIDYGGSTTLAGQFSTASGPVAGVALELASLD